MFVVSVTMCRELFDDVKRYVRDRDINGQKYNKITSQGNVVCTNFIDLQSCPVTLLVVGVIETKLQSIVTLISLLV